jgi:hypothetical protein
VRQTACEGCVLLPCSAGGTWDIAAEPAKGRDSASLLTTYAKNRTVHVLPPLRPRGSQLCHIADSDIMAPIVGECLIVHTDGQLFVQGSAPCTGCQQAHNQHNCMIPWIQAMTQPHNQGAFRLILHTTATTLSWGLLTTQASAKIQAIQQSRQRHNPRSIQLTQQQNTTERFKHKCTV